MPGTPWNSIDGNQMLTYDDVILAKNDGYLKFNASPPPEYVGNELVSVSQWETFVDNGFTQTLGATQIVWKDAVKL